MHSVTVYNTDSIKARDILSRVPEEDVLTETLECVGKVYIEQCFFDMKRRFDGGLGDLELKIIGTVKELFIEDYDNRQFPCSTKNLNFIDAEPVIINMQLTAKEKGHLFECGVDHPGFEPPTNMKYNVMEIPMLVEYRGIYESPVCFARIIRPNEIQTSTKKCGYYGLFDLVAKHPDVALEEQNGGIDINLTRSYSPELSMMKPEKVMVGQKAAETVKSLAQASAEQPENKSVAAVRETITERMSTKPAEVAKPSEVTEHVYHEAVKEYTAESDNKDATNISDIDTGEAAPVADNVVPYTVRQMDSGLYDKLSQKVEEHAEKVEEARKKGEDIPFNAEMETDWPVSGEFGDEDKSLSKAEREKRRQINLARKADIAADNKALNEDPNADISGQGASTKKTSAQELLGDIMGNSQKNSSGQQFL